MKPSVFLSDPDVTLWHGDVLSTLRELPAESVDCVVTSPPYWGLRDYGTAGWQGGDEACDHLMPVGGLGKSTLAAKSHGGYSEKSERASQERSRTPYRDTCGKCGATRIDQQLGLEPTPEQYVERMVEVFREVRRVLSAGGTVWLNLGDSYAQGSKGNSGAIRPGDKQGTNAGSLATRRGDALGPNRNGGTNGTCKPKDLIGIPWRVAFALQADGWYLRSDIIWAKPNPMPESVTDRPTKAHEYVFLLSKQPRYFFDQEAVREAHVTPLHAPGNTSLAPGKTDNGHMAERIWGQTTGRNIRSVWEMEQTGRAKWSKHTLDDCYFSSITAEERAYWLGFLYADAHVGERHVDLQLSVKDREHILRFRDALDSSYEPKDTHDGRIRVFISSKRMAQDLMALGIKTQMRIPDMPDDLVRHFVRGLFDGDGSAWKYLPSGRTKWRYGAQFLGTERMLLGIRVLLGLKAKPKLERGIHRISIASAVELARLYDYLYDGANVWLERKRVEFPQAQHVSSDVWPIATQPYPEAHFATFPEELARRAIAAGCPEQVCRVCGKARERVVEREGGRRSAEYHALGHTPKEAGTGHLRNDFGKSTSGLARPGWRKVDPETREHGGFTDCDCPTEHLASACPLCNGCVELGAMRCARCGSSLGGGKYRPGIVLDPFMGSGTVAHVARKLSRHSVGIDLSAEYLALAARRLQQQSLFAEAAS